MKQPILALLALTLTSPACGAVGAGDDPAADGGDDSGDHRADGGADPVAPIVTSVTPADGARGVAADAHIVVAFSQPMDAESVEAAWTSALLPADAVAFSWNAAGDAVTVIPDEPLPIAEGTGLDPDTVEPMAIAFTVGDEASAASGAQLAEPLEVEFRTVRRLTVAMRASLSASMTMNGSADESFTTVYAGDSYGDLAIRLVLSFPLPELPSGAAFEAATFSAEQVDTTTGIFTSFGHLAAVHIRFADVADAYAASALENLGDFSASTRPGSRSLEVTDEVAEDLEDGFEVAQFRLQFPTATDDDGKADIVQYLRNSLTLSVRYLVE